MKLDAQEFFRDYNVNHATEGHKHCQPGWIQTPCPFCSGNDGMHLGYNIEQGYFNCWRCGFHPTIHVIANILNVSYDKSKEIYDQYKVAHLSSGRRSKKTPTATALKLPKNTPLTKAHKKYLISRKFNPNRISRDWDVVSAMHYGRYKNRILIPIYFNGRLVSYQGRMAKATKKSDMKYKACRQKDEVIFHQSLLYGLDYVEGDSCIVVEGVTDVWRLGYGAVCCFGIDYTPSQMALLAERFSRVFVLFDDDPQAIKQAEKMAYDLSMYGVETEYEIIDGDPGDLSQFEANQIKAELLAS